MEYLDGARGDAHIDLGADQRVRHRVVEALDIDVIVEPDPSQTPFGELVIDCRQAPQRRPLDGLEQVLPAHPEAAHDVAVQALNHAGDCGVGFGEREECLMAQPPENVALG